MPADQATLETATLVGQKSDEMALALADAGKKFCADLDLSVELLAAVSMQAMVKLLVAGWPHFMLTICDAYALAGETEPLRAKVKELETRALLSGTAAVTPDLVDDTGGYAGDLHGVGPAGEGTVPSFPVARWTPNGH